MQQYNSRKPIQTFKEKKININVLVHILMQKIFCDYFFAKTSVSKLQNPEQNMKIRYVWFSSYTFKVALRGYIFRL